MKYEIIKTNAVNVVVGTYIVEAKNKVAAIKSLYTTEQVSEITIGLRKDGKYTVGANANQYKAVYAFNRTVMTVTPVIEVAAPVIMMPIGW